MPSARRPRATENYEAKYKEQKWQNEQLLRELSMLKDVVINGKRTKDELL